MSPRVLLIEDEDDIRLVVRAVLARSGFHIDEAVDGASARIAAESGDYDVVILDMGLPDVAGCDVLQFLRERCSTPILVLTARSDGGDRDRALACGADAFMQKPFDNATLVATLEALTGEASRTGQPR